MFLKEGEGEFIIVAGRPSHGKSSLMFQLAQNVAKYSPVYVVSLEMSRASIVRRLLASELGASITHIQKGLVKDEKITAGLKRFSELKYYIDDSTKPNVYLVCDAIRQAYKRLNIGLAVVDYLQLVRIESGHSTNAEVGKISGLFKELAKELRIPIIVGSQLSRANETRGWSSGNYKPMLSDLRDSGSIEQDADIVTFVHRQCKYTDERPGMADIIVAKNRNGAVGEIEMQFSETMTKFIETI